MRIVTMGLLIAGFFCVTAQAMSTWQYNNTDSRGSSYQGTSNAEGYTCIVNDGLNGKESYVHLYGEQGLVASGPYDMSKGPDDNCSELYSFSSL